MIKLIKAELYKYYKRPFIYVVIGALISAMAFVIYSSQGNLIVDVIVAKEGYSREAFIKVAGFGFPFITYILMLFSVVMTDDLKAGTIKNLLSSNVNKYKIFLSRFIVQVILAFIVSVVSLIAFFLMISTIEAGNEYSISLVRDFLMRFAVVSVGYVGMIALINFLSVLIKNESVVSVIYYFIILQISVVIFLLKKTIAPQVEWIQRLLITYNIGYVGNAFAEKSTYIPVIVTGLIYATLFTLLGMFIFNKQEIK
ncbi:ABC transporter permease [Clostridium cadaveris]|uniref:ABC transporter permease n=1 Tax=Clostridium cadaveris TaxID=1529 RepID=UPI001E3EF2C6|nr:ABC transporter permease [Clostridium cadaveris]UFH65200.1 ABC transporter permease [Clostridium cadaveris]